jgi:hypothetical protein
LQWKNSTVYRFELVPPPLLGPSLRLEEKISQEMGRLPLGLSHQQVPVNRLGGILAPVVIIGYLIDILILFTI